MNILLHTIALEPARQTPQKISRPLAELLPTIAGAGFYKLEVFEPHLALLPDEPAMVSLFAHHHLVPVVLDSSLELSPHLNPDGAFQAQAEDLLTRVDRFGFGKVRLSPGKSPSLEHIPAVVGQVAERLHFLATQRPRVEFLLETHDDSLADDPGCVVTLVEAVAAPNVGLLWRPTVFEASAAKSQWEAQAPFVRHFHLQNRTADGHEVAAGGDALGGHVVPDRCDHRVRAERDLPGGSI